MADEKTVQELVEYYSNLLIVQYHNKPKAKATIEIFVRSLLSSGIFFDVQNGFSVETAIGVQLDIVGKYVGVNRFYKDNTLIDFFAFTDYIEVNPDADDKFGFTTYADYDTSNENGTLNYNSILTKDFKLNDEDYRTLIKLKIVQNTSNHSHKSIDDAIFSFFGNSIIADSSGDMEMFYIIPNNMSAVIAAVVDKEVLPRPMGVGINFIQQNETFFGFATYASTNPNITGFTDYTAYDTKEGEILNYDKITYGGL